MLRRETQFPRLTKLFPLQVAASGIATLIVAVAIAGLLPVSAPAVVVVATPRPIALPFASPRPVLIPVPVLPRVHVPAAIDGWIERVAASSEAPVIAIATKDRVWISRDDGATFAPALDGTGEVTELFVDPSGTVYAARKGTVAVAAAGAPERASALPPLDGRLLDAGGDIVIAEQWDGGVVGALAGDLPWRTLLAGGEWGSYAAEILAPGVAHLVITQRLGEHHWSPPELHVTDLRGGRDRVAWRGRFADSVGFLRSSTPCAGLAGDTLWIVQRDSNPEDSKTPWPGRLLAVRYDGSERQVEVGGLDLDADRVTCSIAGNPHGAFASIAVGTGPTHVFRLDGNDASATYVDGASDLDVRAVDCYGHAIALAGGALVLRANDGARTTLARGR